LTLFVEQYNQQKRIFNITYVLTFIIIIIVIIITIIITIKWLEFPRLCGCTASRPIAARTTCTCSVRTIVVMMYRCQRSTHRISSTSYTLGRGWSIPTTIGSWSCEWWSERRVVDSSTPLLLLVVRVRSAYKVKLRPSTQIIIIIKVISPSSSSSSCTITVIIMQHQHHHYNCSLYPDSHQK